VTDDINYTVTITSQVMTNETWRLTCDVLLVLPV